jgi:ArsR family transcriptional regulator
MRDAAKLSRIFKVLSVEVRVRIIQLLKDGALCVGALSARLGVTQGAVSQHLRILRDAELVVPEKRGYYVHYRLNEKTFAKWKDTAAKFLRLEAQGGPLAGLGKGKRKGERACPRRRRDARSRRS